MNHIGFTPGDKPVADSPDGSLQTLVRGLAVLDIIACGSGTVSAKEVGARLEIRTGTVYHLIRTLRDAGYIRRIEGGTYDVGPMGARLGRHLEERTAPSPEISSILSRLHHKTRENAYVTGWYHGSMMMLQAIQGTRTISVRNLEVGFGGMYHARASCKAILAFLPRAQVVAMLGETELEALTPHTITDFDDLLSQLQETARRGYALDLEEFAEGVACISAPFFDDADRPIGSFSVNLPAARFAEEHPALVAAVQEAAGIATTLYRTGRLALPAQSVPSSKRPIRRRRPTDPEEMLA